MIYFDWTATTKPLKEILDIYHKVQSEYWYNPSSPYTLGLKASNLLDNSINVVKETLNLKNHNVIFTSGATEGNNLAIYGIANNFLNTNKKIITTRIEHPSVLKPFQDLETKGFEVVYLDVDSNGTINLKQLETELNSETILVSIMWVNNIVGAIEPIKEVINLVKKCPRCKLHVDATQGIGKIKPNFDFNEIDLVTMSSHKIEGIKGTGILLSKTNLNINPLLNGSGQQLGIKPGTIDLAGAVTSAKALKLAIQNQKEHFEFVLELQKYLLNKLNTIEGIYINNPINNQSPFINNISIVEHNSETVMHYLESKDIFVAIGSACNSKTKKPEKTVFSITNDELRATTSIRISLSYHNTKEEIDLLINALKSYLNK